MIPRKEILKKDDTKKAQSTLRNRPGADIPGQLMNNEHRWTRKESVDMNERMPVPSTPLGIPIYNLYLLDLCPQKVGPGTPPFRAVDEFFPQKRIQ